MTAYLDVFLSSWIRGAGVRHSLHFGVAASDAMSPHLGLPASVAGSSSGCRFLYCHPASEPGPDFALVLSPLLLPSGC